MQSSSNMRWFNPFPLDDESIDYNAYLLFGESDSAFYRVLAIFLVVFINLIIGCTLTILLMSLRVYITKLIHCLCCGFCDDCDCDYDGTHPSRTISNRHRRGRNGRPRRQPSPEDPEDDRTIEFELSMIFKLMRIICIRCILCLRHYRWYLFLLLGALSSLAVTNDILGGNFKEPETRIHSFSNYSVFTERTNDPERVYFVTVTSMSGIQPARLTRIAQALYPNREFVTWIIVTKDPKRSFSKYGRRTEHWTFSHISKWKTNSTRVLENMEDVQKIVEKFGIPFVILPGYEIYHENTGFEYMPSSSDGRNFRADADSLARYVGILWATKTFSNGVLMVGDEDTAYNHRIFEEIQTTKLLSSWPMFSKNRFLVGLYAPLETKGVISGYFEAGISRGGGSVPLQFGNHAINISFANRLLKANVLWKLSMKDDDYGQSDGPMSEDIFVKARNIQLLGNNGSEIHVWRLLHSFPHIYKVDKIRVRPRWWGTNIDVLLEFIRKWFAMDLVYKNFFVTDRSKKKKYKRYL